MPPTFQTSTGLLGGAAVPAPLLGERAIQTEVIPENFISQLVFPDARTEDMSFIAPRLGNSSLEVEDDDEVGRLGDLKEVMMSVGSYEESLGLHGRMVRIGQMDITRARQMQKLSGGRSTDLFNLELMGTNLILSQMRRRRELLAARELINEDNYDPTHIFDPIDVVNDPNIRGHLARASNLIEDDGERGPANLVIIGGSTIRGLEQNAAFLEDLAENERKFLTRDIVRAAMTLPEAPASTRVVVASARSRATSSGPGDFMIGDFIWVGRVDPAPAGEGTNESAPFIPNQRANSAGSFGWGWWMPMEQNGQQYYVNRLQHGHAENISIGVQGWWLNAIENAAFGVLIPTTNGDVS